MKSPPIANKIFESFQWASWFQQLFNVVTTIDQAGTTANRPVVNLFVGQQYFDTTLGKPIFLKSHAGGVSVWVLADGTAA
jgi:hypothetical protein